MSDRQKSSASMPKEEDPCAMSGENHNQQEKSLALVCLAVSVSQGPVVLTVVKSESGRKVNVGRY